MADLIRQHFIDENKNWKKRLEAMHLEIKTSSRDTYERKRAMAAIEEAVSYLSLDKDVLETESEI